MDDTRLKKTGRQVARASWHRDPLSPPFHANLMWGLRFLQVSLLLPMHPYGETRARGVPIRFVSAPVVKRPAKRASPDAGNADKRERKQHNVSTLFVAEAQAARAEFDRAWRTKCWYWRWTAVSATARCCKPSSSVRRWSRGRAKTLVCVGVPAPANDAFMQRKSLVPRRCVKTSRFAGARPSDGSGASGVSCATSC